MKLGELSQRQLAVRDAVEDHRMTICDGAVRSGKTVGSLIAWLDLIRSGPAGNLAMVGKTERTLKRNVIDQLSEMLGPRRCRYVQGSGELFIGKRRIYVYGANDERAQEKLRGVTLGAAYVDEASTVPESFWIVLSQRLSEEGARLVATTNPDSPHHWLKRQWLDKAAHLQLARVHFCLDDNAANLGTAYIEAIKREHTGLWYRRFIEGEWVAAEGAVYDMFDHDRHITDELPAITRWWLAIDYGTATVTHALLCGLGSDDRLYVAREWRWDAKTTHRQLTDAEYSERLREWVNGGADGAYRLNNKPAPVPVDRAIIDPSAVSFDAQLRRDRWVTPRPAENDVLDGIRYTASLLSADRLRIHRSCEHLIRELAGYVWDPKAQERGIDAPIKADDHGCLVAGTPITTSRGLVPIEEIRAGDQVLTRAGWRPVLASEMTSPAADVVDIELSNGECLTGTADHPVWVEGTGWVRLDALRYGDRLRTWSKSSSSTASSSVATRTLACGQRRTTSLLTGLLASVASAVSTRRYGRQRTVRSPRVMSSITWTGTASTMKWPTLPASRRKSTIALTEKTGDNVLSAPKAAQTLRRHVLQLLSGTALRPVELGIESMGSWFGKSEARKGRCAHTAGSRSNPLWLTPSSARTSASLPQGVHQASITKSARVSSAESSSESIVTCPQSTAHCHVLAVTERAERLPVYNLLVSDAHEYFASGVLCHNCDALRYLAFTTRRYTRRWLAYRHEEAA